MSTLYSHHISICVERRWVRARLLASQGWKCTVHTIVGHTEGTCCGPCAGEYEHNYLLFHTVDAACLREYLIDDKCCRDNRVHVENWGWTRSAFNYLKEVYRRESLLDNQGGICTRYLTNQPVCPLDTFACSAYLHRSA